MITVDDSVTEPCTVAFSEELLGELDRYCRENYIHRDAAVSQLLGEWLEKRAKE